MLKALLVDDEFPARAELKCLLEEIGGVKAVAECEDGQEALDYIEKNKVDVVFLDIQMNIKDGLTAAREILQLPKSPYIVFTTGFSEFAVKAFELNAVDYVVKPYSGKRLAQTIDKLIKLISYKEETGENKNVRLMEMLSKEKIIEQDRLPVWVNDRMVILALEDILYVTADKKGSTVLYAKNGNYFSNLTLNEIEDKLKPPMFFRTHKSFLVNLRRIKEIIPWFNNTYVLVFNECKGEVPVSRHYIKEFNRLMGI